MYKLIFLMIIFVIQSFPSYGKLKAKYLYCEIIKDSFKIGNEWTESKLLEKDFGDKLMGIVGITFEKYKLNEYSIMPDNGEGTLQIEVSSYKYFSNDKYIYWTIYDDTYPDIGRTLNEAEINRENLELKDILKNYNKSGELNYTGETIFQCNIMTRPKLFFKLRQKVNEFEKIRKGLRKNNKL